MVRCGKLPDVPTFYEQGLTEQASRSAAGSAPSAPPACRGNRAKKLSDLIGRVRKTERIQKIIDTFRYRRRRARSGLFQEVMDEEGPFWIGVIKSRTSSRNRKWPSS